MLVGDIDLLLAWTEIYQSNIVLGLLVLALCGGVDVESGLGSGNGVFHCSTDQRAPTSCSNGG